MDYKFIGQMDCDHCRYHKFDCKVGESCCPYLAGWHDGQEKLHQWLMETCEDHPILRGFGMPLLRRDCQRCQKELNQTAPVSPKGGL